MATAILRKDEPRIGSLLPNGQRYLRKKMEERGLTVTELAAQVGVSRKHLSNVLGGHVPLVEPLLGLVCRALFADAGLVNVMQVRPRYDGPTAYGALRGTVELLCDPTEPMTDWEMLEE